tara:strand:+ start:656 stop:949 length:294 start_codon:yes stop_codon:yes gene_type:complete
MTIKENQDTIDFISDYKQKTYLKKLFLKNTIELNNYFAYSGREEKTNPKVAYFIEKEKRYKARFARGIKNDMSKYKLKNESDRKIHCYLKSKRREEN